MGSGCDRSYYERNKEKIIARNKARQAAKKDEIKAKRRLFSPLFDEIGQTFDSDWRYTQKNRVHEETRRGIYSCLGKHKVPVERPI